MIDRTCHGPLDVLARLAATALPRRVVRFAGLRLYDHAGKDTGVTVDEALRRWDGPDIPGTTIVFCRDESAESTSTHSICATEEGEVEIQFDDDTYLRFDRKRLLRAIRKAKP